jgi:hypothetical protein
MLYWKIFKFTERERGAVIKKSYSKIKNNINKVIELVISYWISY